MSLDYATLDQLRQTHPAWRLLRSDHAPLVASFLERVFVLPNRRDLPQAELVEALEDELYALRERLGEHAFPKPALVYLNDWAHADRGWLRKFYLRDSDEAHFDLTPASEKAVAWLAALTERSFVGTESRLLTLFTLLQQMRDGSDTDPETRAAELRRRRAEIDAEIVRVEAGDAPLLDDTALRDRFQQFTALARELLGDFRQVEDNFRRLDRSVRERIAAWQGGKGALLGEIMGERDAITDSDQGRSFHAFWDFLMSGARQERLSELLEQVLALPAITDLAPDPRLRRVHYDWLEAGEHAQRTVAQLSQQLRRFIDDQAWLENRRIMDLLHGIEHKALALRETPPDRPVTSIATAAAGVALALERPLFTPPVTPQLVAPRHHQPIDELAATVALQALYRHNTVDLAGISEHVRRALAQRGTVTLRELCEQRPLEQGLSELVAYLQLASDSSAFQSHVDETVNDDIEWIAADPDGAETIRRARLPRVIFAA